MPKATAQTYTIFLTSSFTILVLMLSLFNLNKFFTPPTPQTKVLGAQVDLPAEKKYWQDLTAKNPTYRDGYIELSKIECELGETENCHKDLTKAQTLDPNFLGYPSF